MKRVDKRKLVDWDEKNDNDKERISKRLEGRNQLADQITTTNDTKTKITAPRVAGAPLLKLRKKIREVYDEDDEDEDEVTAPFFNITLIDDDEREKKEEEREKETFRITKQQQMAGKLNMIMNAAMMAEAAGLSPKITKEDNELMNSAEFDVKKMRRKTIHQKIEEPLKLQGEIKECDLEQTVMGINKAQKHFSLDSLAQMPAEDIPELNEAENQEDLAKLILKKSGRKTPKKTLAELAKDINRVEQTQQALNQQKEKELQ